MVKVGKQAKDIYGKVVQIKGRKGTPSIYSKMELIGFFDKKIQEYLNRENLSGTKRLALDNAVLSFDDVMDAYWDEKHVSLEKREQQSEVIATFFDTIIQYNASLDGNHNKFKTMAVNAMKRTWSRMDRVVQDSNLDELTKKRIVVARMDDFDVYLFKGLWAVVPSMDGDVDDEFEEEEVIISQYITVMDDLSEEVKNQLQRRMKSNFMFFFEDNKWFIVDGVFIESHEALSYVEEQRRRKEESRQGIGDIVQGVLSNRNVGRTPEQPTQQPMQQQTAEEHGWDVEY